MNFLNKMVRDHEENEVDLMAITGIDIYKYASKILSVLFSNDELKAGSVDPVQQGRYPQLDAVRINHLKSKHFS